MCHDDDRPEVRRYGGSSGHNDGDEASQEIVTSKFEILMRESKFKLLYLFFGTVNKYFLKSL